MVRPKEVLAAWRQASAQARRWPPQLRELMAQERAAPALSEDSAWSGWPDLGEADGFGVQIVPGEACADGFYYAALTKQ